MANKKAKINRIIGLNIKISRIKKELTQEQLAFESGLSKTAIGNIERGEMSATVETLDKLAKALQTTISELTKISK